MSDLLETQGQLQAQADQVVRALQLNECLSVLGQPIRVGSSAMGLMVRRDIDITVICAKLDADALEAFSALGAGFMRMTEQVVAVRFRNDCGQWNREPEKYPDGLYLWLSVQGPDRTMWTIDIWLVDQPERQPDIAHLKSLMLRLTDDDRETILRIKTALAESPQNGASIPSALVYEAVMDYGIDTIAEFENWYRGHEGCRA